MLQLDGNLNVKNNATFEDNVLINKDLSVTGNLSVYGNISYINTKHVEIQDPIITIGNNIDLSLNNDTGILLKNYDSTNNVSYSGLIKKSKDDDIYLVKTVKNNNNESINTNIKEKLILKNINTSHISSFVGGIFKDNIYIPENKTETINILNTTRVLANFSVRSDHSFKYKWFRSIW